MQTVTEIHFVSIDLESIENVEDNPEAVTFDIILSSAPTPHWMEEFEFLYSRSQFGLKPPIHIVGDRMHIMYLPRYSEELQGFVTFISLILERATQEVRRTLEILQTDEKEKLKAEFRDSLASVELPRSLAPSI